MSSFGGILAALITILLQGSALVKEELVKGSGFYGELPEEATLLHTVGETSREEFIFIGKGDSFWRIGEEKQYLQASYALFLEDKNPYTTYNVLSEVLNKFWVGEDNSQKELVTVSEIECMSSKISGKLQDKIYEQDYLRVGDHVNIEALYCMKERKMWVLIFISPFDQKDNIFNNIVSSLYIKP